MEKIVKVELGPRSYDIRIARGAIEKHLGPTAVAMGNVRTAVAICDATVGKLFSRQVMDSLTAAGLTAEIIQFPAGEQNKNIATVGKIFDELFAITPPIDRDTLIIALGGGVSGDIAGFVAATALRGLRWLQCPTTLLADVDSSVGGKTGVDHEAGKNLIGAFYQPGGVIIDTDTLKTLPVGELRNGLVECVKHAVIRDASMLDFIEENAERFAACDDELMAELIARNVQIKATVVSADERETLNRADLNFGHTIGHAIETFVGYDAISHGQGVALGMVAACGIAVERGLFARDDAQRVTSLLEQLGLKTNWEKLSPAAEQIWKIMHRDKKVRGGKVRMVLPIKLGAVEIFDDIQPDEVYREIKDLDVI